MLFPPYNYPEKKAKKDKKLTVSEPINNENNLDNNSSQDETFAMIKEYEEKYDNFEYSIEENDFLVSILNVLIQAFGNSSICLVIDELDAGIFEYMLGELLDIFNKSAKGQLIFTSHNLRALEMLDKDSIMFSTANPNNRYIHMKNVKGSNNLRSMYIRSITLGGQEEKIYEETDSLKIARAFRKAGRRLRSE